MNTDDGLKTVILNVLYDPLDNCGEPVCVAGEIAKAIRAKYVLTPRISE